MRRRKDEEGIPSLESGTGVFQIGALKITKVTLLNGCVAELPEVPPIGVENIDSAHRFVAFGRGP
jgi:hypothetical protein